MARKIGTFMGATRFRGSTVGSSAEALNRQFQEGMKDILGNLESFIQELGDVMPEILVEALEPTLGQSLEECPVEDGDLRASAYLEAEKYYGGARAVIGYGRGGAPSYAIYVHEMPYHHEAPTKYKFLQDPLDENYFSILQSIPRLIRESAGT